MKLLSFLNPVKTVAQNIFNQIRSNVIHSFKQTLEVEVYLPAHKERKTTALFERTKKQLVAREGGKCFICGATESENGNALEAHHFIVEWAYANAVDWKLVQKDFPEFPDWDKLFKTNDYSLFVDNMLWNGKLLCHSHHVGNNKGIHFTPYPLWIIQRYLKEGYKYSDTEIIHHENK